MLAKFSLGVLYDQATAQVPEWGSGADGLQKRAEWRMAGLLSRASAEYAVAKFRTPFLVTSGAGAKGLVRGRGMPWFRSLWSGAPMEALRRPWRVSPELPHRLP